MKRGEIWALAGGGDYARKPRPSVIVQDNQFHEIESITICGVTTNPTDAPLFRVAVEPSERNGLRSPCHLMADKVMTVRKTRLRVRIGQLDNDDMVRLNRAIMVFLGLAGLSTNE
jgi:mRNA interferase MazF